MPIAFTAPNIVRWPGNHADRVLELGVHGAMIGFAEPFLNGTAVIQARGLMGNLPPLNNLGPTFHETVIGGMVPTNQLSVAAVATHSIRWDIHLPVDPVNGVWTSTRTVTGWDINKLVEDIRGRRGNYPANWNFHLVIEPLPSAAAFMNHCLWHEMQHAADHHWLAEQIIGPWDTWLDTARAKNLTFEDPQLTLLRNYVLLPGNYATSVERIFRYWQSSCGESGVLFHRSPNGLPPIYKIKKLVGAPGLRSANMVLHLTVEPTQQIMAPINYQANPHTWFVLPPMHHALTGNDAKITASAVLPPARVITTPVDVAAGTVLVNSNHVLHIPGHFMDVDDYDPVDLDSIANQWG